MAVLSHEKNIKERKPLVLAVVEYWSLMAKRHNDSQSHQRYNGYVNNNGAQRDSLLAAESTTTMFDSNRIN